MSIPHIENLAEYEKLSNDTGNSVLVLDFYADWCGPCKRLAPELEKLAQEHSSMRFLKVNVDQNEELTRQFKIEGMPTIVLIRSGKELQRVVGANLPAIKAAITDCA